MPDSRATTEETTMNRTFVFTALALALVSAALAEPWRPARSRMARRGLRGRGRGSVADPRVNKGTNHEGWCDLDPQCNGWNAWLQDVNAGKLSAGK